MLSAFCSTLDRSAASSGVLRIWEQLAILDTDDASRILLNGKQLLKGVCFLDPRKIHNTHPNICI